MNHEEEFVRILKDHPELFADALTLVIDALLRTGVLLEEAETIQ